jgi:hypothetical protein
VTLTLGLGLGLLGYALPRDPGGLVRFLALDAGG